MLRYGNKIYYFQDKIVGAADKSIIRMPKNSVTNDRKRLEQLQAMLKEKELLFKQMPIDKLADQIVALQEEIVDLKMKLNDFYSKQQSPHKIMRRSTKKRSDDWVYKEVLKIIQEKKKSNKYYSDWYLTKEDVAIYLKVKEKQVDKVFMRLNQEGVLEQPIHRAPHDTNRSIDGFDNCRGWASDLYYIRKDTEEKTKQE